MDENISSSGEEFVHLDHEYSSGSSDSDVARHSSLPQRKRTKKELSRKLKEILQEIKPTARQEEDEANLFKVIGESMVGPTTVPKYVSASWVANSTNFDAQIAGNANLSPFEENSGLIHSEFFAVLRSFGKVWFPVQKTVLPFLLDTRRNILPPRDVVISSPTGSGKTLCFLLPILNELKDAAWIRESPVFAIVVAPMLNLAQQIFTEFERFNVFGARIVALTGRVDYARERSLLFPNGTRDSQAHIIVATPGRLVEHLLNGERTLDLSRLRYLVVDEADRMQDTARMEWLNLVEKRANVPLVDQINLASLTNGHRNRWLQRILVSATLSLDMDKLHVWSLRCPKLFCAENATGKVSDGSDGPKSEPRVLLPDSLIHNLILCKISVKPLVLFSQLNSNKTNWKRVIVFVNKKSTSQRLAILLSRLGKDSITVAEFSSNLFRTRRLKLIKSFQRGEIRVLVSCDLLSRGIDIVDVDCVINYDVPINQRIFVHRAGRTARAMNRGSLISLVTKEERMRLKKMLTDELNSWSAVEETVAEEEFGRKMTERYRKALDFLGSKMQRSRGKGHEKERRKSD